LGRNLGVHGRVGVRGFFVAIEFQFAYRSTRVTISFYNNESVL
jgi:hypothetical protein